MPATAFGLVYGRLGCLGAGCGYGRPATWPFGWEVPWSIRYYRRGLLPEELLAVPLHPAPLYESLGCLVLFVALSKVRATQTFAGQTALSFVLGYGLLRVVVEAFRADVIRGVYAGGWLSTSQLISLGLVACVPLIWRFLSR
jgi:phosphatidylglycerol:prolipoprotein diacylglycerol transferase